MEGKKMDYSEKEAITNYILSKLSSCSKEYMYAFETVISKFLCLDDEDREIVSLEILLKQELPPIYHTFVTSRLNHIVGELPTIETERLLSIAKDMHQQLDAKVILPNKNDDDDPNYTQ
jgi:hypothetical protein